MGQRSKLTVKKIRKMFPNQPSARYNIIQHQHDISSMEVHIDKNLVYMYLLEIDKAIRYAIDDGCKSLKKKSRLIGFYFSLSYFFWSSSFRAIFLVQEQHQLAVQVAHEVQ